MANYISVSGMYTLGFIKSDPQARYKQGLPSQVIANVCMPKKDLCNNKDMYPALQRRIQYHLPKIRRNCACDLYIKPP